MNVVPLATHLASALSQSFARHADSVALKQPGGPTLTYRQLWAKAARLAHGLTSLGVTPGARVAVQVEKSVDSLALYLACVRMGAVFLPLNPAYQQGEIAYFLSDAAPALFITKPEHEAWAAPLAHQAAKEKCRLLTMGTKGDGSFLASLPPESEATATFPDHARKKDDLAAILYTSGTTGRAKGAMLTDGNLLSNALTLVDTWRFTQDDVLLHALPIFHTHGLFVASHCVLLSGASMIFIPAFANDVVIEALKTSTAMMGVPTFYTRLLADSRFTRDLVEHMRLFISGSAPLLASTHKEFSALTGHAILERYGMTETGMNTSNPYDGERRPGTVGFPLEGVSIRVADDAGNALPQGQIGTLEVKGPNVCHGYWQNPEKTKAEWRADGYFITGDVGMIDGEGYISIVGRAKDLVISGGFNVYPKEVENVLDDLPGVAESTVIGVPHPDFGEAVVALLRPMPDAKLDEAAIIAAVKSQLANFKVPKRVFVRDEFPRNAMGKIEKAKLREEFKDLFQKAA